MDVFTDFDDVYKVSKYLPENKYYLPGKEQIQTNQNWPEVYVLSVLIWLVDCHQSTPLGWNVKVACIQLIFDRERACQKLLVSSQNNKSRVRV